METTLITCFSQAIRPARPAQRGDVPPDEGAPRGGETPSPAAFHPPSVSDSVSRLSSAMAASPPLLLLLLLLRLLLLLVLRPGEGSGASAAFGLWEDEPRSEAISSEGRRVKPPPESRDNFIRRPEWRESLFRRAEVAGRAPPAAAPRPGDGRPDGLKDLFARRTLTLERPESAAAGGGGAEPRTRRRRSWLWNQFFVIEEYQGPEPVLIGRVSCHVLAVGRVRGGASVGENGFSSAGVV